ncbi:MAG: beta-hydroxyacyl-ACP dehydratase [Verrucomicrobia bacterium TMED44]|nr:MAG: beta-hydroxyacyl-ACP dehydratase [Verrucomicrobia bacterium TMED44]|tara:strand:+ start:621 stop:1064 length:444 start_codon:yes stop_codon:yes gene_type:complete
MEDIHRRIPHRPPFLFVDRIIEINAEDATCELSVREDFDIFKGHYPNNPIFPGVLSCEAVFQTGAIFLSEKIGQDELNSSSVTPVLSRIRDARFKRMIKPGDLIQIKVFLQDQIGQFYNLRGEIRLKGKVVTTVSFALALVRSEQSS